jgi:hypothetical protein
MKKEKILAEKKGTLKKKKTTKQEILDLKVTILKMNKFTDWVTTSLRLQKTW